MHQIVHLAYSQELTKNMENEKLMGSENYLGLLLGLAAHVD